MNTNRDYYSWSQHSLFKSSKLQFYKRYVLGEELHLPAFDKGKEFANYRETKEIPHFVNDPLLKAVSDFIPELGIVEKKMLVPMNDINLLCYIDECKEDLSEFNEYKTGKNPWTQKMVDDHQQLDFYALIIYLETGVIPKCKLYWIETEEVKVLGEKKLMYTGHVESFEKIFTEENMKNIAFDIADTYAAIQNYEHEEIELEDNTVDRYIELLAEKDRVLAELDLIKLSVLDELNSVGAKYAKTSKGRFSISERKTPIYSKELLTKEKQYKNEIDKLKKKEKDSPDVKYTITESILFKAVK